MSKVILLPLTPIDIAQYLDIQAADDVRIKGRRIGVEHIVYAYNEGYSPEQIASKFRGLDLKIVYTIIAYYLHHRVAVDTYIDQLDLESASSRCLWEEQRSPASLRIEVIRKEQKEGQAAT
jgi:uncharacterized protein (DUF433 family)